jgi:thiamine biosynthesis protein ThiS
MSDLALTVNGDPMVVPGGSTIADVVVRLLGVVDAKGIAVAVERDVVPHSAWVTTPARAGSHIEIVTAAAGG